MTFLSLAAGRSVGARHSSKLISSIIKRDIKTLTLNAGSTTLKYSLYDVTRKAGASALHAEMIASGLVDKVGGSGTITHNKSIEVDNQPIPTHTEGLRMLLDVLKKKEGLDVSEIACVGHRVVHGGATFSKPTIITPDVLKEIKHLSSLAPLHNPPAVSGIEASGTIFPSAMQVAIFDTAFHTATMPPSSYRYAIPKDWYEKHNIRRYGFHGTSYSFVTDAVAKYLGKKTSDVNLIVAHMGGGASMCCIKNGQSIDTTMGLTPLEGLVMASRAGDLDLGVYDYLLKNGFTSEEIYTQLNKKSGLLGLTGGQTSDMREVSNKAMKGDADCQLARAVFAERCRKYLGSYLIKLGGEVDAIVFTGGIGEGDVAMRQAILEGLDKNLSLHIDASRNMSAVGPDVIMDISPPFAKTKVLVVPTDEEVSIAMQSSELALPPAQVEAKASKMKTLNQVKTNLFCHSLGQTYTVPEEVGLMNIFASSVAKIGYFRPVARKSAGDHSSDIDNRIELMKKHFNLKCDSEAMYGVHEDEALLALAEGREEEMFEKIIEKYLAYSADKEFVMISSFTAGDDSLHWAGKICSSLNIPSILIGDASHDTQFGVTRAAFEGHGANVLGAIMYTADLERDGVTKNPDLISKERKMLEESGLKPLALIPTSDILGRRSVREVMTAVKDGVCLYGHKLLDESINNLSVYTMQVDDLLEKDILKDGDLVMVSHKRVDVLMSLLLAAQSKNSPTPAGILLSGFKSGDMSPKVTSMLSGLDDIRFPIIATSADTFHAAKEIEARPVFMTAESTKKLAAAKDLMEDHLDFSFLDHFQSDEIQAKKRDIGPRMFQYSQVLAARKLQKTIVLPEGADPRVVEAASILVNRKLCKVLLVGDPAVIKANADKVRVSLEGVTICDPQNYEGMDNMINAFVEARKSKGLTAHEAENFLKQDVNYFGTLMMHLGNADGMVSGAMHSSANTIRPALQVLKTAPGAKLVSSFFFMLLEDGVKVFGDCAINVSPTADELAEIAVASAKNAIKFGIDPRVALLSYATGDSNKGDLIDKVVKATAKAKEIAAAEGFMDPDLIQGPLQFDAAVDPAVAAVKAKDSRVAGRANVLIFPDLNSGNNGYKAVQQASKTIAVGPVLQGLKKPVNDLSRGATVDDIVNTAIITALQA